MTADQERLLASRPLARGLRAHNPCGARNDVRPTHLFPGWAPSNQRDGTQLHHVTVEGLDEWIAWWDAQEASA